MNLNSYPTYILVICMHDKTGPSLRSKSKGFLVHGILRGRANVYEGQFIALDESEGKQIDP